MLMIDAPGRPHYVGKEIFVSNESPAALGRLETPRPVSGSGRPGAAIPERSTNSD